MKSYPNVRSLPPKVARHDFTICTLVTHHDEYEAMIASFHTAGFSERNSDFLYIDNSQTNVDDGYTGLNRFLNEATGNYIIIAHQDILLSFDTIETLYARIEEMNQRDPHWGILGNAGFAGLSEKYYRISDPWRMDTTIGELPAKVKSLDENFLVIKKEANLALSHNLKGFHMYGADVCTIASLLGWNAYVIDFHLYHKSAGNCNESFSRSREAFMSKYTRTLSSLYLRTTCTTMIITNNRVVNWLLNRKIIYSLKKRIENITAMLGRS